MKKASTDFRRRLFGQKEEMSQGSWSGLISKIPEIPKVQNPAEMVGASNFEKANIVTQREINGLGPPIKQSQDTKNKIHQMFSLIEEKTSIIN